MSYHVIGKHNQKKIGKWKKLKRPKLENKINPSRSLLLIIHEGAWAGGWGGGEWYQLPQNLNIHIWKLKHAPDIPLDKR